MPKVKPLPIKTKNKPWYKATWLWMTKQRRWELLETYHLEMPGQIIIVPGGFIFDGASIPRVFWWFLSPTGLLFIPALCHDFGYKYNKLIWYNSVHKRKTKNFNRRFWDDLFLKIANHVNGMNPINRTAWLAVRSGGWRIWNKYRKRTNPAIPSLRQ